MTKFAGIIGYPAGHSISPVFQQAAFDHLGIDARYEYWETLPEDLDERIASLRDDAVLGGNVTIPHKQAIIPMLDRLDDSARAVGAVNTVLNRGGVLTGYNTDVHGLRASLESEGVTVGDGTAVVLGAGGSARAAVYMLLAAGSKQVSVVNRTVERAESLVRSLLEWTDSGPAEVIAMSYDDSRFAQHVKSCSIVLNCTSVGMKGSRTEAESPVDVAKIGKDAFVYDLVYTPAETTLVRESRARGLRAANGLGMLIHQGAGAFRLWTSQEPPVDIMMQAGRKALGLSAP